MKKVVLLSLIFSLVSYASSEPKDRDMDGVADIRDKCPSTPFFDLVNSRGCTVKTLVAKGKQ